MKEVPSPADADKSRNEVVEQKSAEAFLKRHRQLFYLAIMLVAVVLIVAVVVFVDEPENFEGYIKNSGYAGVLLMGIIGSASPIWPLPGSWAAFIAGGLGLNPIALGLAAGFGEPVGEFTAYMAGYGGHVAVANWKRYEQINRWMARHGALTIFLISAIPNHFTKLGVISAGVLRYPWWRFFLICWAGKTLKSFGFALAGAGFFDVIVNFIERLG